MNDKLFNENINLVYAVYESLGKSEFVIKEKDDIIQEGMIGLWKAVEKYDETKSAFSTFAFKVIKHNMLMYINKNKDLYKNTISLDEEIDEDGNTIGDTIAAPTPTSVDWLLNNDKLNDIEKYVARKLYEGYTQTEISKTLCCSQSHINKIIGDIRDKTIEEFENR